ncbi:MAG: hypothetical protein M3R02_15095 [Chloroflexota bacterium]|nr:hypothetical protein [Chloroflexota bacterium]
MTAATRAFHLVVGSYAYLGAGQKLYRSVSLGTSAWADFVSVADFGTGKQVTGLAYYQGNVAVLLGTGADIQVYDVGAGTVAPLLAGTKGRHGVGYAGRLVFSNPVVGGADHVLKMTTGGGIDSRELDAPIVNIGLWRGKVVIATRQSLWFLGGRSDPATATWTTEPEPFFTGLAGYGSGGDDFAFLLGFGGKLYTWLNNQVVEYTADGDRAGWRATGVEGKNCYGATVTGGMLVVSITTRLSDTETWAFDGSGWWLIHRAALGTGATRIWPMATGGAGEWDLILFRDGSTAVTYDLYRLVWRSAPFHTYAASGAYRTSLLDCGERDKPKAWRRVGATLASPEQRGNPASADAVTLTLAYSVDGGKTFTTAASVSVSDPTQRALEMEAPLGDNVPASHFLQLRLTYGSVADWAPVLTGLWAEYELLDSPARRRWAFKIHARDALVQRDGSVASRGGRQLAADLWSAWRGGATLAFQDLDADVTGETATVRIVGIAEEVPKPADGGRWGESVLALTLVEV